MLEPAADATVGIDQEQRIAFFDPAAEAMFECTAQDAIGVPITHFINGWPDGIQAAFNASGRDAGPCMMRLRGPLSGNRAGRSRFALECNVSKVLKKEGCVLMLVFRDIAELDRHEGDQALLEELGKWTHQSANSQALISWVTEALGIHLHADRCFFGIPHEQTNELFVEHEFRQVGMPSSVGAHTFESGRFNSLKELTEGHSVVVKDQPAEHTDEIAHDDWLGTCRSYILVPLRSDTSLRALIGLACRQARQWSIDEIGLITEVADRFWACLERQRLDSELRESAARCRAITELVPMFVYEVTADGRKDYFNAGFQEYTGQSAEESGGDGWAHAVHPEERERVLRDWRQGLARHQAFSLEFRLRGATGGYRWFRSTVRPIENEGNEIQRWVGCSIDIDDLVTARSQLSELNQRLVDRASKRSAQLQEANKERILLEQDMQMIGERERIALSMELHDGLCQHLSGLAFMGGTLARSVERRGLQEEAARLNELTTLLRGATEHAREMAHGLHPVDMDARGLQTALRRLASKMSTESQTCVFQSLQSIVLQDNELALQLYRIAQEAVTDCMRRTREGAIVIRLLSSKHRLVLSVSHHGSDGVPSASDFTDPAHKHSVKMMRYRAHLIGGSLVIDHRNGGGTVYRCILPNPSSKTRGHESSRRQETFANQQK